MELEILEKMVVFFTFEFENKVANYAGEWALLNSFQDDFNDA